MAERRPPNRLALPSTALVESLIQDREAARERRDFAAADRIRAELAAAGVQIEDTPTGSHWSLES